MKTLLKSVCAWCGKDKGYTLDGVPLLPHEAVAFVAPVDVKVSHGICPDCAEKIRASIAVQSGACKQ